MRAPESEAGIVALEGVTIMIFKVVAEVEDDGLGQARFTRPHETVVCGEKVFGVAPLHAGRARDCLDSQGLHKDVLVVRSWTVHFLRH